MTAPVGADQILFRSHPSGGGSEVSAALLAQSLTALQEMVYLAALQNEGRSLRERLRLTEEMKERYVLLCAPPQVGSFSVVGRVVNRAIPGDLLAPVQAAKVATIVLTFCHAVSMGNATEVVSVIPDSRLRDRMITCVERLSPALGSGQRCEVVGQAITASFQDEGLPREIKELQRPPESQGEMKTVTGRLCEIDFVRHRLTIFHTPTHRELECLYDESIEPMLLENRRDLIQVTGLVIVDEDGQPKRIVDVEQIWDLDLSPFVIAEASGPRSILQAKGRVELSPKLTPDEQLVCIEYGPWGLDVFAETRTELLLEARNQLLMLWSEYAREADEVLSGPALKVKRQLLVDWAEVARA